MKPNKVLFLLGLLGFVSTVCFADSIRISQLDSGNLLLNQTVNVYVSATDNRGIPITNLKASNFEIKESKDGRLFEPIGKLKSFQSGIDFTQGVSFLLLLDNSESMYWSMEGNKKPSEANRRINIAKGAIKSFISSIKNPNDRVGIAAYNSYYTLLTEPSNEFEKVGTSLNQVVRPKGDAIYSEIYGSVKLSVDSFNVFKGRKAIVILSDGVNNPSYNHTKKINEQFGTRSVPYQDTIDELQSEGISLFVIYFGKKSDKKDRHLKTIATESGGMTFVASNQQQLHRVYAKIMDQIQKEYILTYKATMTPSDKKWVRVNYNKGNQKKSVTRHYLSSSVFGNPIKSFSPLMITSILIAVLLLWLLSRLKFEKQRKKPSIEVLDSGAGKLSTQVLTLGGDQTVIGCAPNADMTIAGLPAVKENHATVIFNESDQTYALQGNGKLMVNNQIVTTKILEPGDLINVDGVTMIFDEGTDSEKSE